MPLRKPDVTRGTGTVRLAQAETPWVKDHPVLVEYLSSVAYEDGSPRKTSSMTVFVEEGLFKVCLSDRDLERSTWGAGEDLFDLLDGLEIRLADGSAEWRKARPSVTSGKRK